VTPRRAWVVLALAPVVVLAAALLGRTGGGAPASIEDRVQAIAAGLRCPVCQNLSVADSPSRLAGEMRREIDAQVRAGRSDEEIRAFFVDRYGEWVLLEPTRRGLNLLPWLVPVVGLLGGLVVWGVLVHRRPDVGAVEEGV
jgi:cytochrome c-type biogenesis protein CcmH